MKRALWTLAAAFSVSVSGAAAAQQAGDWVLAQWQGGSDWYPGVIMARLGNQVTIRYDDGTSEIRPINQVRRYDWRVGSGVTCRFTDGRWYHATITGMAEDGLTISVRYDDGDTQVTNTGRCRSE
jgi:hypothetical protein